jgi:uncharacterized membrane protein
MNTVAVTLRLIHIVCGVYWAGTMFFVATLLQPSVAEAGPEGGKVIQALMRRRFLEIVPVMAAWNCIAGPQAASRWRGSPREEG